MRNSTTKRWQAPHWLWGLLLVATVSYLPVAQGQEQCPAYREPDDPNTHYDYVNDDGKSIQFEAPDGCPCVDGMSDLYCAHCETDQGCQSEKPSQICSKTFYYTEDTPYKSYKCRLFGLLEGLFTNGKLSIYVNTTAKEVFMTIYNWDIDEPINGVHAVDCVLSGCDIPVGGTDGGCASTTCKCTDECSDFTRNIMENLIGGNPATVNMFENENGGSEGALVKLNIDGAPFKIEALCNASACVEDPNYMAFDPIAAAALAAGENATLAPLVSYVQGWETSSYFALIVLVAIVGFFCFLTVLVAIPYMCTQHQSAPKLGSKSFDETTSYAPSPTGSLEQANAPKHVLEFRHISKVVKLRSAAARKHGSNKKAILNNISGRAESGTLMAIMGPSGSGKSSLLNVIATVATRGASRVSGQILLNGVVQKRGYRNQVAYVQQDDSLYSTLTVRECLEYSALLRLPKAMKVSEKQAQVWQTLQELRLTEVSDNRIGATNGNGRAGISGGERKRVSIGMELVAKAPVICLDEPTSGLDAYGANQLVKVLHQLAARGNRVVILSIHQPSMKSFMSMDKILLLGHGRCMYTGSPDDVAGYLEARGFPCPPMETVADHMLDVVSKKKNLSSLKGEDATAINYARLCVEKAPESNDDPTTSQPFTTYMKDTAGGTGGEWREISGERHSIFNEITVLFARAAKDIIRNKELFLMQVTISLILALFAGGIFNDVSNNLAGFQNRTGAFYFSLSFFAFASFSSMDLFIREQHIFVRETGAKYYGTFPYFLTKKVLDLFMLRVIPVALFTFIFYWMMGLKNTAPAFVTYLATMVLFNVCAGVMSICISIATPTVGQANLIAAVWFLVMLLFGGFLLNIQTMDPWYSWLKYLSIFYYAFEVLMANELMGLVLSFDAPGYPALPVEGEVFLQTIGMNPDNQLRNLICLCALALGFAVLAFFLLLLRVPPSANKLFTAMQKENKRLAMTLKKRPSTMAAASGPLSTSGSARLTLQQAGDDAILISPASHASNDQYSFEAMKTDLTPDAVDVDSTDSDAVEI
ncbi:Putative white-brown complex homolog protein 30 [Seminavis robusta]|uniref:White-brown complex homolog protein 30 n=1 Tax=Seminavis robusta TaxID=568900 RepID=A0A9N8E4A7_9STRA|nr:Putative white-brown complex homolog protein 30 [Seminavis robusta]|eukprot:Sro604_g174070.1 Putative white-brown complex homolog protein 30 (1044) ;mRNA; f:5354-8962